MTNEEFSMTEKSLRESTLGRSGERCEENGLTMVARWREKTVLKREAGVAKDSVFLSMMNESRVYGPLEEEAKINFAWSMYAGM